MTLYFLAYSENPTPFFGQYQHKHLWKKYSNEMKVESLNFETYEGLLWLG